GCTNLGGVVTAGGLGRAKGEGRVTWEQVEEHAAGLFCLAGGDEGPLVDPATAATRLDRLKAIFDGRLAVDVHHHLDRDGARGARRLTDLADAHRVPVVVTNDVRHAVPQDRALLDVLTC